MAHMGNEEWEWTNGSWACEPPTSPLVTAILVPIALALAKPLPCWVRVENFFRNESCGINSASLRCACKCFSISWLYSLLWTFFAFRGAGNRPTWCNCVLLRLPDDIFILLVLLLLLFFYLCCLFCCVRLSQTHNNCNKIL